MILNLVPVLFMYFCININILATSSILEILHCDSMSSGNHCCASRPSEAQLSGSTCC